MSKAFLLLMCSTLIFAETWLSPEKEAILQHQSEQIDATHEKMRYEWISPLIFKAQTGTEHSALGTTAKRSNTGISISQDLFRSGGIEYTISYADSKFEANRISLNQMIASLREDICLNVLKYRKNLLLMRQSNLKLKNNEIEIFLKRKQYEAGAVDITLLNRALMDKSIELKNNAALLSESSQLINTHRSMSDSPIDSIDIPVFTLISKETFVNDALSLQYENTLSRSKADQYNLIRSSYLPTLALIAEGGYQYYDADTLQNTVHGNYYSAFLNLSIPLSYTAEAAREESFSELLAQKAKSADTKRQIAADYNNAITRIENHNRLIQIFQTNLSYYDELIQTTKTAVDAGYKAGYDLMTLQNTREIESIEIELQQLEIQIESAKLHFSTTKDLP